MAKNSVTRTGTIVRGGTRTKDGVPLGIHSYTGGEYGQWAGRSGRSIAGPYAKAMPAPTGEEVTGNRLNKVASALKQIGPAVRKAMPAPTVKPASKVVSNVTRERLSPVPAAAAKPKETAYQRQQRMAQQKMGVAGPRSASKASSSGTRSTGGGMRSGGGAVGSTSGTRGYSSGGNVGRGDVGAGRRGGGR